MPWESTLGFVQLDRPLDNLPLWGLFAATIGVSLAAVETGFRLGQWRQRQGEEPESAVGAIVGATLGLLAFMLAFTFGQASSTFSARTGFVLDEANAIHTAYLRADLVPEPQRTEIRRLLRDYVDVRLEIVQPERAETAMRRAEVLQEKLWAQAVAVGERNPGSALIGLFVGSANDVIDFHAKRLNLGLRNRVPVTIWAALYFVAISAMGAVGYHTASSKARSPVATLALVLPFSAIIWLIADLDRPQQGMLRVSQQAMVDLKSSFAEKP